MRRALPTGTRFLFMILALAVARHAGRHPEDEWWLMLIGIVAIMFSYPSKEKPEPKCPTTPQ